MKARSHAAFDEYLACMQAAGSRYVNSTATPYEIADAAQASCGREYSNYEIITEDYLASVVSPASAAKARSSAKDLVADTRAKVKGKVVQMVVEARIEKR